MEWLQAEVERLREKPNRQREYRRVRREQRALRGQLVTLERRIEELAAKQRESDPLAALLQG